MPPHSQHVRRRRSGLKLTGTTGYIALAVFVAAVIGLAYLTFNGVKNLVAKAPLGSRQGDLPGISGDAQDGLGLPGDSLQAGGENLDDIEPWTRAGGPIWR